MPKNKSLAKSNWVGLTPERRLEVLRRLKKENIHRLGSWAVAAECDLPELSKLPYHNLPNNLRITLQYAIRGKTFSPAAFIRRGIAS
jgi:hypothetical protein